MADDKQIRQRLYKRDKDFNEKIKEEMQEEENMLKSYFKQYKKPVSQDPSIMKREENNDKLRLASEVFSPFRVFRTFYDQYWNLECATPEQRYVLNLCKQKTKSQITQSLIVSTIATSLISYKLRMAVSPKIHFLSFTVGIASGLLYGVIKSCRYSLQKYTILNLYSNNQDKTMRLEDQPFFKSKNIGWTNINDRFKDNFRNKNQFSISISII